MPLLFSKLVREKNVLSFTGNFLYAILGLLGFVLLTRSLDKESFGAFVLYITLATFVDLFRFGLTRSAMVRYISGASEEQKKNFLAEAFIIGLFLSVALALTLWIIFFFLSSHINNQGYYYFFLYYPLLALANLSWNNALSLFQAEQKFGAILRIRSLNAGSFLLFLILNYFFLDCSVEAIIIASILTNLLPSLLAFFTKTDGAWYCFSHLCVETRKKIIHFGKYSIGTIVGSSLLKSADVFIIGLSPVIGTLGVALYAIPLKLTELIEIVLRSFVATAFPKMSKASIEADTLQVRNIFYTYSGAITLLLIPFTILAFIFAEEFVWILGGDAYREHAFLLGNIFRVFLLYGLLLPFDRLTGVALDSINKPRLNFYKVLLMAAANIAGDLIAVFVFQSIFAVAVVTVAFTLIGVFFGYWFLNREISINPFQSLNHGILFYRDMISKIRNR